jgi:cytochrome c peroxidase
MNQTEKGETAMRRRTWTLRQTIGTGVWVALLVLPLVVAAEEPAKTSSYAPVAIGQDFPTIMARMKAAKAEVEKRQTDLLKERYDLSNRPAKGVAMSRGKAIQEGVRAKLPAGVTWDALAAMSPAAMRDKGVFPAGFLPLPHPNHPEGGMLFAKFEIDEIKKQEGRDLTRFDLDFDLLDHFLPEFPAPIYLTTRPDLGDVSQGKLLTIDNYYALFNGILNPKQIEGLRLLLTPFPQQQFNQTEDRRSERPSRGVACFDCHANGHTNGATHLVGDIRPQEFRHRIETPSLRGVNIQRLFGSQRALKSVEDFTEFEQRAAYFDGDPVTAQKKGVNILERGSQVHFMAEFQELLDFPPAPKLGINGKLDPTQASEAEMRGQDLFFGKATCGDCHPAPYYTDNTMHNLKVERFYTPRMVNGEMASADGPIKTFPLRGVKDSPPYLHDGRLLTLEDTVEFFNLVTGVKLNEQEKHDLVAFMRQL